MLKLLKNISKNFIKIIYPNKCIFCLETLPINEVSFICKTCDLEINFIEKDKEPFLTLFEYNDLTKPAIYRLKYSNRAFYAKYFAKMMYDKFKKLENKNYDLIVNVPMHKNKKKKRGYDQAELLAIEFSKLSNIDFEEGNLIRKRDTIAQSKVCFDERMSNLEDAFEVKNKNTFKNKNILLIDDIYTSGSTIFQCLKVLNQCNVNYINTYTLSKVIKDSHKI